MSFSTFGDRAEHNFEVESVAYVNYDNFCNENTLSVTSFTFYKIQKLCSLLGVDYFLYFVVILVFFLIPGTLGGYLFWNFRFPDFQALENHGNGGFQELTLSLLFLTELVVCGLFFATFSFYVIPLNFLYVYCQLRLSFRHYLFEHTGSLIFIVLLAFGCSKFIVEILLIVFSLGFECPISIRIFCLSTFLFDVVIFLIPLSFNIVYLALKKNGVLMSEGNSNVTDLDSAAEMILHEEIGNVTMDDDSNNTKCLPNCFQWKRTLKFFSRPLVNEYQMSLQKKVPKVHTTFFFSLFVLEHYYDNMIRVIFLWIGIVFLIFYRCVCGQFVQFFQGFIVRRRGRRILDDEDSLSLFDDCHGGGVEELLLGQEKDNPHIMMFPEELGQGGKAQWNDDEEEEEESEEVESDSEDEQVSRKTKRSTSGKKTRYQTSKSMRYLTKENTGRQKDRLARFHSLKDVGGNRLEEKTRKMHLNKFRSEIVTGKKWKGSSLKKKKKSKLRKKSKKSKTKKKKKKKEKRKRKEKKFPTQEKTWATLADVLEESDGDFVDSSASPSFSSGSMESTLEQYNFGTKASPDTSLGNNVKEEQVREEEQAGFMSRMVRDDEECIRKPWLQMRSDEV